MSYITTVVQPLKSYPTYQFYARADSRALDLQDVFKVCILETFRWLKARLKDFNDLPDEITTSPEPDKYGDFSDDALASFSYTNGVSIDVIYIEKEGVWSFLITETDMGANIGKETERPPVQGRIFNTQISFRKQRDYVEIGEKTICSEPMNITEDCEVFRPRVIRALTENANIRLIHGGFILDKKPLEIKRKTEYERFLDIYENGSLNFPIILIADSETATKTDQQFPGIGSAAPVKLGGGFPFTSGGAIQYSIERLASARTEQIKTKLPALDHIKLAEKLVGFAVVVFAEEKYFKQLESKLHIKINYGDVIILSHKVEIERYAYSQYKNDMDSFLLSLRSDVTEMPKRKQYDFGEVLFHSDAKLQDYHAKRHETTSLEDQCSLYELENAELKKQIEEYNRQAADKQQVAETLRAERKRNELLQKEVEELKAKLEGSAAEFEKKEDAYRRNAELVQFYKEQVDIAASFPTDRISVCQWIDDNFSEQLIVSQRARMEMKKFNGPLDVAGLCDGILFLNAYVRFRRREISEDTLKLYAERNGWEVQGCGKEALKMRKQDYTFLHNDKQYLLDLHIKRGVSAQELLRIYFCWNDTSDKLIIGSMPDHLATKNYK